MTFVIIIVYYGPLFFQWTVYWDGKSIEKYLKNVLLCTEDEKAENQSLLTVIRLFLS